MANSDDGAGVQGAKPPGGGPEGEAPGGGPGGEAPDYVKIV